MSISTFGVYTISEEVFKETGCSNPAADAYIGPVCRFKLGSCDDAKLENGKLYELFVPVYLSSDENGKNTLAFNDLVVCPPNRITPYTSDESLTLLAERNKNRICEYVMTSMRKHKKYLSG